MTEIFNLTWNEELLAILIWCSVIACSMVLIWYVAHLNLCFLSPQGTAFFPPFLFQQQPPQVLNFNPAMQGPFLPQINQLNPAQLPPFLQEQPIPGIIPNNGLPAQNLPPVQTDFYWNIMHLWILSYSLVDLIHKLFELFSQICLEGKKVILCF